jgi:negative regulator of flagellin synthesis FlgM
MKIVGQQHSGTVANANAPAEAKKATQATQTREGAPTGGEDRVDISPLGRTLQSLRAEIGDVEAVDHERLEKLRAAIADGTYSPSPRAIADALLRELAANRR